VVPIFAALHQGLHFMVAAVGSPWQYVIELIGSGFNPILPAPEADVLPLDRQHNHVKNMPSKSQS